MTKMYAWEVAVMGPDEADDLTSYGGEDFKNLDDAIVAAKAERDRLLSLGKDVCSAHVTLDEWGDNVVEWFWDSMIHGKPACKVDKP